MADTFKLATGWLGWSPETALTTPIPQIELALEGLRERHGGTTEAPKKVSVAEKLKAALRGLKRG